MALQIKYMFTHQSIVSVMKSLYMYIALMYLITLTFDDVTVSGWLSG